MTCSDDRSLGGGNPPDLQMQALTITLQRLLEQALEPLQSRLDKIYGGGSQSAQNENHEEIDIEQLPRVNRRAGQVDDNLSNIKIAIPSFQGRSDLDAKEGKARADYVKRLHQQVKENLERRTQQYEKQANKVRKRVTFDVGDWVWVHFRNERFPAQRRSKLLPKRDGPFQVLEKVNDNAYKLDLPGDYNVSATFIVSDLSPYDDSTYLRTNPFQEGGMMEIKGHDVRDLSLARLKFRSSYAARFSSTKLTHFS
ncbi:hypothetical protein GQ457_11G026220 [Hibiscus cannabinus]